MQSSDVLEIIRWFESNGIDIWLAGGWGVDALLGKETRLHSDLDVINRLEQAPLAFDLLGQHVSGAGGDGQQWVVARLPV